METTMSKKKKSKWSAWDDEGEDFGEKKRARERKQQRRIDRALKIKDVNAFVDNYSEDKNANVYVPRR